VARHRRGKSRAKEARSRLEVALSRSEAQLKRPGRGALSCGEHSATGRTARVLDDCLVPGGTAGTAQPENGTPVEKTSSDSHATGSDSKGARAAERGGGGMGRGGKLQASGLERQVRFRAAASTPQGQSTGPTFTRVHPLGNPCPWPWASPSDASEPWLSPGLPMESLEDRLPAIPPLQSKTAEL
jgi:hypothetical protein